MYRIAKSLEFSASHVLDGLPEGHQCGRLHGHNYVVEVELASDTLTDEGFVLDYGALDDLFAHIKDRFDHRHLNDHLLGNPTAENLARVIYEVAHTSGLHLVSAVRVRETPKTLAEYRP